MDPNEYIYQFERAIKLASKIDGCNLRQCNIRDRILKGETDLIDIFCDICKDKIKTAE